MSGPNPPGPDSPTPDEPERATPPTGETEIYSRAYSAPESEHFTSGPYVAPEASSYDYDDFQPPADVVDSEPPRWPWVVGVVAIVAAVALVASVAVLVTRTENTNVATPSTSTTTPGPPVQDEITTTTPPPPPPPPPPTEEPPPPPPETVTVTQEPPPPQPEPSEAPPPPPPPPPPPTATAPAGPRFITYTVTGTKAPLDRISVTYTDASGRQRTQQNVYIPWSLTVTPISMSEYGSVQASSLLRLSKLNCSITTSDGQTIASQQNNDWQTKLLMTHDVDTAERPPVNPDEQDQTDRILLAVCAALWLAALGTAVAAIVALVDLANGHATGADDAETPWLLYTVIGVSAVVIAGAIPLLIRARRTALQGGLRPAAGQPASTQNVFGPPLGTETSQRSFGGPVIRKQPAPPATSPVGFPTAAVEQVWLRCSVLLACAVGAATAAVGIGTYLMASDQDGLAWAAYGVAALVTVAMPAVPWFFLRQLHQLIA